MIVDYPSPNHAERPAGVPVDHLVLHYTELSLADSLAILRDRIASAATMCWPRTARSIAS